MREDVLDFWVGSGTQPALGAGALAFDAARRTGMRPATTAGFVAATIGGTLVLYGGRRLFKFPNRTGAEPARPVEPWRPVSVGVGLALLTLGVLTLPLGQVLHLALWGLVGAAYCLPILGKRLREYGALKPAVLALAWTAITCPPVINTTTAGIFAERLPALYALCLLFDLKDRIVDERAGVLTPALVLKADTLRWIAAAFLLESLWLTATLAPASARAPALVGLIVAATLPPYRSTAHRSWVLRGDGALIALGLIPALLR